MFRQSAMCQCQSEGVEVSGTGNREGQTDFIHVTKSDNLGPHASSSGVGGSMWKRVFISNIEERLVQLSRGPRPIWCPLSNGRSM